VLFGSFFWPFLMSNHGIAFTVADGIMYFIFYLVEVIRIMHIIVVTLLHIIHLVTEALLLLPPLSHLSCGHVWYIVQPIIQ
jgi:lipoprotein signal peptidase